MSSKFVDGVVKKRNEQLLKEIEIEALVHLDDVRKAHIEDCVFLDKEKGKGIYVDGSPETRKRGGLQLFIRGIAVMRAETGHLIGDLRDHEKVKPHKWRLLRLWRWHKERVALVAKLATPFEDGGGHTIISHPPKRPSDKRKAN
jgi:hypothetical protein